MCSDHSPLFAREQDRKKLDDIYDMLVELKPMVKRVSDLENTVYGINKDCGLVGDVRDAKAFICGQPKIISVAIAMGGLITTVLFQLFGKNK